MKIQINAYRIVHIIIVIQSFAKHTSYGMAHTAYCTHTHHIIVTKRY